MFTQVKKNITSLCAGLFFSPASLGNSDGSLGSRGEREATRFLKNLGYHILATGQRQKLGEIDIIAVDFGKPTWVSRFFRWFSNDNSDSRTIVFVEVKTRKSTYRGLPSEAVDEKKQTKIATVASSYLKQHRLESYHVRLDVVSILWQDKDTEPEIEHLVAAFDAPEFVE